MSRDQLRAEVHDRLGYRRLNRGWAKAEILLGLTAAGAGLFLLTHARLETSDALWSRLAGLALFVLGGCLAVAGHRSHLYPSSPDRLLLLVEELRLKKGNP